MIERELHTGFIGWEENGNAAAVRKLWISAGICFVFMIAEVVGGIYSNSLAVLTDAAHLLSDLASFLISIFAIYIASTPATKSMSFGWHRAEILGAILSVFLIWLVTGILVYEAILRVITPSKVNGEVMFFVAAGGVCVNIVMALTLGHGHSHGGSVHDLHDDHAHSYNNHNHLHDDHAHGHDHHDEQPNLADNINVRAAFLHVLGDLIQSIGVCISGGIIWYKPEWDIADPIATFLFSILVMATTYSLMQESIHVLMEGTPQGVCTESLSRDLRSLNKVIDLHDLHVWSVSIGKIALSVHVTVVNENNLRITQLEQMDILCEIQKMIKKKYGITHSTIQLELCGSVSLKCDNCLLE